MRSENSWRMRVVGLLPSAVSSPRVIVRTRDVGNDDAFGRYCFLGCLSVGEAATGESKVNSESGSATEFGEGSAWPSIVVDVFKGLGAEGTEKERGGQQAFCL